MITHALNNLCRPNGWQLQQRLVTFHASGDFHRNILKLLCNFIYIKLRHGCPPVNLLHFFRIRFHKNTSEGQLLDLTKWKAKWTQIKKYKYEYKKISLPV